MTNKRQKTIARKLANEGLKTLDFFRALKPADYNQQVYTDGSGWTVRQILCHILNAEQGFHHLINDILLGGAGAPESLDIDQFNEERIQAMDCGNPEQVLRDLAQARVTTIEIVHKMRPADFDRQGRHPFLGITSVENMLKLIYRHVMIHQRDIRRAIDQAGPVDVEPAA